MYRKAFTMVLLAMLCCPLAAHAAGEDSADALAEEGQQLVRIRTNDPKESRSSFQFLLGRSFFSTVKVTGGNFNYHPPVSGHEEMESESQYHYSIRFTGWPESWHRNFGMAMEVGNLSVDAGNNLGSTASASLLSYSVLFLYKAELFRLHERRRGRITPYMGLGFISYIGSMDVYMPQLITPISSYHWDVSFPDLRAGLMWNLGENSSMLIEWRYISLDLVDEYTENGPLSDYDYAEMSIEGSIVSLGVSWML